jgi:hypothetical protein
MLTMLTDQSEAALRAANDQLQRELDTARTELAAAERRVAQLEGTPVASRLPPAGGHLPELRERQALLPCPVCGRHHERIDIQRGAWRAVEIITDNKWALVVLYVLSRGATRRYNQLLRMIVGVSQKAAQEAPSIYGGEECAAPSHVAFISTQCLTF